MCYRSWSVVYSQMVSRLAPLLSSSSLSLPFSAIPGRDIPILTLLHTSYFHPISNRP
jgi:hypothetical protein